MSTAKWQNITGSKKFFNLEKFDLNEKTGMPPKMPSKKFVKLLNPEF